MQMVGKLQTVTEEEEKTLKSEVFGSLILFKSSL